MRFLRHNATWALAAVFLSAGGGVLMMASRGRPPVAEPVAPKEAVKAASRSEATVPSPQSVPWRVAWRAQVGARPNRPSCAFPEGWVVTDRGGGVAALSGDGALLWRTVLTNQGFEGAAFVGDELAVAASVQGDVTALRLADGGVAWAAKADARFQHQPLCGAVAAGGPVLWLVSQSDGGVFCFRLKDGGLVWKSEPTNRCDGEPAVVSTGKIVYGNCDGAVHVFDGADGALLGSVAVGENDQMAGGMLSVADGVVFAGTRQGNLVAVDVERLALLAQEQVSEGEVFLEPAAFSGGLVVMGNQEGELSFWRLEGTLFRAVGRVALGVPVGQLDSCGDRLFALAGGRLAVVDAPDAQPVMVALGDDVYGLRARGRDSVACVADGMVVCIEKEDDKK